MKKILGIGLGLLVSGLVNATMIAVNFNGVGEQSYPDYVANDVIGSPYGISGWVNVSSPNAWAVEPIAGVHIDWGNNYGNSYTISRDGYFGTYTEADPAIKSLMNGYLSTINTRSFTITLDGASPAYKMTSSSAVRKLRGFNPCR